MDGVENDGFTREEILEMVTYLKGMDHKMAVACEMLGGHLHHSKPLNEAVACAQATEVTAAAVLRAICRRHGVEL